jgi:acetyl-CoA carboxylase carboxyltransferase component
MLESVVPTDPNTPYDMKMVMKNVADEGTLFEVMPDAARNIVVGFARLNGHTVGMVGNEPMELAGCLDINSSIKVCVSPACPLASTCLVRSAGLRVLGWRGGGRG